MSHRSSIDSLNQEDYYKYAEQLLKDRPVDLVGEFERMTPFSLPNHNQQTTARFRQRNSHSD